MMMQKFVCSLCGKRMWRKNARLIGGRLMCSTCMFAPPAQAIEAQRAETENTGSVADESAVRQDAPKGAS